MANSNAKGNRRPWLAILRLDDLLQLMEAQR